MAHRPDGIPTRGQLVLRIEHDSALPAGEPDLGSLGLTAELRGEIEQRVTAAGARIEVVRPAQENASGVCLMRNWRVLAPAQVDPADREAWGTWAYPSELLSAVEVLETLAGSDDWSR